MISLHQVEEQLKRIGCNFKFWGRAEIRELSNVLMPDEISRKQPMAVTKVASRCYVSLTTECC